jgi:FtsP/CotA-like multicopper oxidase with cupredoxin domain
MQTRRLFIRHTATGGFGLFLWARGGGVSKLLAESIPGGTLNLGSLPRFVTPLLIPPVMPRAGTVVQRGGKNADYYEISVRQFSQQILPAGLPATTVWGYGAVAAASKSGLLVHNAPSLTIEGRWDRPVIVKWINELVDADGHYLPHLLPVDPTLHWANPPGGTMHRDTRPDLEGRTYVPPASFTDPVSQYTDYRGPVPIVTHVHGAVGVGDESDGYAEAWYLPDAIDIPDGHATEGTWYDFFASKAAASFDVDWGRGHATFRYPNLNRASTLWYHDHTLGMTRLNVYAGPAGFYLLRGGPAGDDAVTDIRSGAPAVLPGPAPHEHDKFPPNKTYYEIPLAIQDRAFNSDGSLFYPRSREFFDGATAENPGFIPLTDLSPIWNPEVFGNTIIVNGNTWPFLDVESRRYRFRLLNGCQSRFLILDFASITGVEVWQLGNDGGFLSAPVDVTAGGNTLLLGPAERADIIVDFSSVPAGRYVLGNIGPDEPFGGGVPAVDFPLSDPESTGQVLEFRVQPALTVDPTTPPRFLALPPLDELPSAHATRRLALVEEMSMYWDGPAEALLGVLDAAAAPVHKLWADAVTENPAIGDTEVWEFYNLTADAHPMHVHEVVFEVVNREALVIDPLTEEAAVPIELTGDVRPPAPGESGFKDTVIAYPGEVTRIRARFPTPGQFVWHCHIVEHEDNEMMRPYRVGPEQPGQPEPKHGGRRGHDG